MDTTEAEDDDEGGRRGRTQENKATSMDATSVRGRLHRLSVIGRRGTADWLAATVTLGYIDAARRFVFESETRWHVN